MSLSPFTELRGGGGSCSGDTHLSLVQFIQYAENYIRTDDAKALSTIQGALCMIETSLRDLRVVRRRMRFYAIIAHRQY